MQSLPPAGGGAPTPGPDPIPDRPVYSGRLGELYRLFLVNLLLTVVTLGIYRFWAKTRMRQYLWRHIAVRGESLEYTGTGKELFVGFLKAALILAPAFIVLAIIEVVLATTWPGLERAIETLRGLIILWLIYVGSFAAWRYRMSRTLWRGIRFRQEGSPWRYGTTGFRLLLLSILTLGLYSPFMNARLQSFATNNLSYGSARFTFDGHGRDLFKRFFVAWLLFIPTLGLSFFWYSAFKTTYYAAHTRLDGVSFAMPVTGGALFRLIVGNLLLIVISFGLLWPIALGRTIRFTCERLTIAGDLDFASVSQRPLDAKDREGLASFLDTEIGIG